MNINTFGRTAVTVQLLKYIKSN